VKKAAAYNFSSFLEITMEHKPRCRLPDPYSAMSLALTKYHLSTPEIRLFMRLVLGHAPSSRTIKRLARSAGVKLKRGRPPTAAKVHRREVHDLIAVTSNGLSNSNGNALHFLDQIQLQFGLTPRQYLSWVKRSIRRGNCMIRKCLFCGELFPSTESGQRHCEQCQSTRRQRLKEEGRSLFN
jgi:hypothetical protein